MKLPTPRILVLLTAGLWLALPLARAAAPADRPERGERAERAAERLQHLAQELGLTDLQKTQIGDLMAKQRDAAFATRDNADLNRREKMKKVRDLREAGRTQIRALLTPEQQKKFDALPRESMRK